MGKKQKSKEVQDQIIKENKQKASVEIPTEAYLFIMEFFRIR